MQTLTYTVTVQVDDDVTEINESLSGAANYILNDLDPTGRSFVAITVTDADGETVSALLFDPQSF